jgi:hypothetical protein
MQVQWVLLDFFHHVAIGFFSVLAIVTILSIGLRRRTIRTVRPRRR